MNNPISRRGFIKKSALANKLTGNEIHEIIGVFMAALFLIHQVLNRRWYQAFLKGNYDMRRTISAVVNALLLADFAVLTGSSAMISRTLFSFMEIDGSLALRQIHTTASYWFLILTAVHLGTQWPRFVGTAAAVIPVIQKLNINTALKRLTLIVIAAAGVYASFERNLGAKLFMTYAFDFWDFRQSVLKFFILNLAVFGLYAVITHFILSRLHPVKTKGKNHWRRI